MTPRTVHLAPALICVRRVVWFVIQLCWRPLTVLVVALALATPAEASTYSQAELVQIIRQAFPNDQQRALCIADRESDGTPNHWTAEARNGQYLGLFQIGNVWNPAANPRARPIVGVISWNRMLEPAYNAMVARRIQRHSGWGPWTTRGGCGA